MMTEASGITAKDELILFSHERVVALSHSLELNICRDMVSLSQLTLSLPFLVLYINGEVTFKEFFHLNLTIFQHLVWLKRDYHKDSLDTELSAFVFFTPHVGRLVRLERDININHQTFLSLNGHFISSSTKQIGCLPLHTMSFPFRSPTAAPAANQRLRSLTLFLFSSVCTPSQPPPSVLDTYLMARVCNWKWWQ